MGINIYEHYILAHKFSINNKNEILKDGQCGCFHCISIFDAREIHQWIKEKNPVINLLNDLEEKEKYTAVCPYCGIDALISKSCGYEITKDFLRGMHDYWFN